MMAGRFVRSSKYRHVFGRSTRKEQCYDNLRVSKNAWDTNLVKVNPEYIAVNWDASGGGAFAVIPIEERGRLPERFPLFRGHTAVVLDTDWNPFNDSLICSASDDGKVFLWKVPDGFTLHGDVPADEIEDVAPIRKLSGHPRKVGHVLFNPAAENVLASASGDFSIKLWDIETGSAKLNLKLGDIVQSLSWSADGSLLVTTSRDKKLRIWDVRQERPAQEVQSHAGAKTSRAVWMGEHDRVATTGFSRMSDRQLALWDIRAAKEPLGGFQVLDSISGVCMPFWDDGTQCLYLAGKGDGNIRYYEYENDKFEHLAEYKSGDPQRGVAFMPRRGLNMHDNEVMRAYKTVNDTYVEPISFIVPRRAETFQEDIYPPAVGVRSAMSSEDWLAGQTALPPKVDMETIYDGGGMKEVPADAKPASKTAESEEQPEKPADTDTQPREAAPATTSRGPPPSMKEQGGSMMAMADKYAAKDGDKGEQSSDESSFEEVQKPSDRGVTEDVLQHKQPQDVQGSASQVAQGTEPGASDEGHNTQSANGTDFDPAVASPTPPADPLSGNAVESLEREVKNLKSIMAQQSRQVASQEKALAGLAEELSSLKAKMG